MRNKPIKLIYCTYCTGQLLLGLRGRLSPSPPAVTKNKEVTLHENVFYI